MDLAQLMTEEEYFYSWLSQNISYECVGVLFFLNINQREISAMFG